MNTIKRFLLFILVALIAIFNSNCTHNSLNDDINKLKYYTSNSEDAFSSLIKRYNQYCLQVYDKSYQIDIIEFDNENDMNTKISTEIMAGKGPDIISLNQKLPFEKLIENGAFLDINTLINRDESEDKIDINKYNSVVMNAGVYNNKRYIIPLFYGVDALVSTEERLEKFGISCNNGASLTYDGLTNRFETYFNNSLDYAFVSNNLGTLLWFDHPMQLFSRFINSYVDFENKVTYFDSNEFNSNLNAMYKMIEASNEDASNALFDDLYINRSFTLITGNYAYYKSIDETPVVYRGLVKNDDIYSAFIQVGFAVNNNTKFQEQAYAFIKYALSDNVQMRICGAKGSSYSASISFPVNKAAYEQSKYTASMMTDDSEEIIGINNNFVRSYINIADNINTCTLYMDVSHSYYNSSVIGDIVDKYLNGDISKDKFIRQLTAATEIYLTE